MFRFLLLRFLPRRLLPFLTVLELVRLVYRWRAGRSRNVTPVAPRVATTSSVPTGR